MLFLLALFVLFAGPAFAKPEACLTSIDGEPRALMYDSADGIVHENRTYRERLFGRLGRITCPGYVTLREMTPGLTDEERALFCLQYDRGSRTYTGFVVGERDGYVGCKARSSSFCRKVNATKDTAASVVTYGADLARGLVAATGLSAREHVSGAMILTGSGSNVTATLGKLGADALAALSAPATLAAAAVTVVAVGGVVYVCDG